MTIWFEGSVLNWRDKITYMNIVTAAVRKIYEQYISDQDELNSTYNFYYPLIIILPLFYNDEVIIITFCDLVL